MTKMKDQFTDNNENPRDARQEEDREDVVQPFPGSAGSEGGQNDAEGSGGGENSLEKDLQVAREEARVNHERYLRTVADWENYRRRMTREKEELRQFALEGLLEDFLPVLDNFRLGLQSAESQPEAAGVTEGFKMVANQIHGLLEKNGLTEINPESGEFDPHQHESVSHQPHDEIPDGHVVQVIRKGYSLNGRLLRPATVIVSSGPAKD